ncbi:YheC/YheD family protein [Cohnella thermotolerans]|uniref:YheC/YheD family protein n=1 Tax=Cohnella thermotolerans TaxID=329858 RepID=UPI0003FF0C92|nr:YheC/YheD family protein [Cohnella thermotolerans]
MSSSYIGSKWRKTLPLLGEAETKRWVPETAKLTKQRLRVMLRKYDTVYVKPEFGTFGVGVMRTARLADGSWELRFGTARRVYESFDRMYGALSRMKKGKSYLVQRGIPLLKHNGRSFDIRVMVQKNLQKKWEATGVIGRVAAKGKVVTNYHSGGTPMPLETLLKPYLSRDGIKGQIGSLKRKGVKIAKVLQRRFPGIREIGVDVGMDSRFDPWVLEVNTRPDPYIFRKLPDKSVVRKVLRYARSYGRIKAKGSVKRK